MGKFIVIEGIDGCGGQTQTNLLKKYFGENNTLFLSFPGYKTQLGQIIDDFLHKRTNYEEKDVEILIYYTDILQFKPMILKALRQGKNVICDRYFTSTITFQSLNDKRNVEDILKLNNMFKLPVPDICFLLDITAGESQKRKMNEKQGFKNLDRNESDLNFLNNVREQYLKIAKNNVFCNWEIIDGAQSIQDVYNKIISKL